MKSLGDSVYLFRIQAGLTQKELALKSGVPQPNLSEIEKGRDFTVSTLYKLSSALELDPADLLSGIKPIALDKATFFQRNNIEKFVNNLNDNHQNQALNELARALRVTLSNSSKEKNLHLEWIRLKRTFSRDELNTLFSRLNKAQERARSHDIPS